MNEGKKCPSNWWYLPPAFAAGFFLLIASALTPLIFFIFAIPAAGVGGVAGVIVFLLFRGKTNAKEWSLILAAWIAAIMTYVFSSLFWCEWVGC